MARSSQAQSARRDARPALLACGYGCFLAFYYACAQWGPSSSLANAVPSYDFFHSVVRWSIVVGYAAGLIWGLHRPAGLGAGFQRMAALAGAVGLALFAAVVLGTLPDPLAACAAAVLLGLAAAALNACWIDAFRPLPIGAAQTGLAASTIFVGLICLASTLAVPQPPGVVTVAIPAAELACSLVLLSLARTPNATCNADATPAAERPGSAAPTARVLGYMPVLVGLVPALACSLVVPLLQPLAGMMLADQGLGAFAHSLIWCAGEVAAGCIMLITWRVRGPQAGPAEVFTLCIPVLVTVAVLFPFLGDNYWPVLFLFSEVLRVLMLIAAMAACLRAANRPHTSPVVPYCLIALLMFLADLVACALGPLIVSVTPGATDRARLVGVLVVFVLACLALVFLFARKGYVRLSSRGQGEATGQGGSAAKSAATPVDVTPMTADRASASDERASDVTPTDLAASCARIAAAYGLSAREAEVLAMQARGRNVPFIADELGVSQATVRSYVKRLHSALDVHTQQELINFVEHR